MSELYEIYRLKLTEALLSRQLLEAKQEKAALTLENEILHHEISYYESLANDDPDADWPHRDGRYRDWLVERLKAARVIENLRNFAQNVRGYVYLHNNGREIRYIDDLSQALLNLLEGKDILDE